jgi:hypothetical protein
MIKIAIWKLVLDQLGPATVSYSHMLLKCQVDLRDLWSKLFYEVRF